MKISHLFHRTVSTIEEVIVGGGDPCHCSQRYRECDLSDRKNHSDRVRRSGSVRHRMGYFFRRRLVCPKRDPYFDVSRYR